MSVSPQTPAPPLVEVIIPVHTTARPIARAVRSVLQDDITSVSVLVVCHGVPAAHIAARLGELATHERVRLLEFHDGVPSPAGPMNEGVRASRGQYLTFLGSDDEFTPGTFEAWTHELVGAPDILIGQLLTETGGRIFAPSPRVGRFRDLDPVRDMLNYRSAPVGALFARGMLGSEGSPRFQEGAKTGEDLGLGLVLWNTAQSIRYSRFAGGYFGHEDGSDRVTGSTLSPSEVQVPVRGAVGAAELHGLRRRQRQAVAVKLLRHQVLEWVRALDRRNEVTDEVLREAAHTARTLTAFAPGTLGYFHRFDARSIAAIQRCDLAGLRAHSAAGEATAFRWKAVPANPFRVFAPENAAVRIRRTQRIAETLTGLEGSDGGK